MSAGQVSEEVGASEAVEFRKLRPGQLPFYQLSDRAVSHGMALGNHKLWVTCKASGAIEEVYSLEIGRPIIDTVLVTYAVPAAEVLSGDERGRRPDGESQFALVRQERPGVLEIHPVQQRRSFRLSGELAVTEAVLVPKSGGIDPAVVVLEVRITNHAETAQTVRVTAYARLSAQAPRVARARYDEGLQGLVVQEERHPERVRIFACSTHPVRAETTFDSSRVYGDSWSRSLSGDTSARGTILGALQADVTLDTGEEQQLCFVAAFSPESEEAARRLYLDHRDFDEVLRRSSDHLTPGLSVAMVETPDPIVNQAVFWAKVNMMRVVGAYPQGMAFTNNPGQSSAIVVRDVVWYTYACDYFMPELAGEMLLGIARRQCPEGKIFEAYHGITGRRQDYGLNINDDTPLFILGVHGHYQATGSEDFLRQAYPAARRAGDYLLSQRDDRGLVFCTSKDCGIKGIASWRNVIKHYQISGAVTEINAECYAALRALSALAEAAGESDAAAHYAEEAERLKHAINEHLYNPENGMYLLNIDPTGARHTEVTADEVFPVMFGVSDEQTSYQIITRLNAPDFMTPAGLRTASRESPEYEPAKHVGLMGGVWPGATFWYAFAAAPYHPEFMAESLRRSYEHYLRDPLHNNTLPGEFSEWFDGESLVNRGMQLSPWEPPRLLWAAVQGACGVRGAGAECICQPLLPPDWPWTALRRLPQGGRFRSFFMARQNDGLHIYSDAPVVTDHQSHVYEEDVSNRVRVLDMRAHRLALWKPGELLVCIGAATDVTIVVPVRITGLIDDDRPYAVDMYDSELWTWRANPARPGRELRDLAVPVDSRGYRIIRIRDSGIGDRESGRPAREER